MIRKKMRKSTVAVLAAFGVLALISVFLVGIGRLAFSRMASGDVDMVRVKDFDHGSFDFGNRITTEFDVEGFNGITFVGTWKVDLEQGDEWKVELTYPEFMEDDLSVKINEDQLILDPGSMNNRGWGWNWWGNNNNNRRLSARIVMPRLSELNIAGASNLDMHGFAGEELFITISGAGNVEGYNGKYSELFLTMSGAGNVEMRDMEFRNARVILSGAGNVELGMDGGELTGNLSGFGNIEYYGHVSDERVHVSGFGKVRRRN